MLSPAREVKAREVTQVQIARASNTCISVGVDIIINT